MALITELRGEEEKDVSLHSASNSIFCHLAPYMLSSTLYSCGPDINACCKFDFTRSKCWKQGAYRDPAGVTTENINDLFVPVSFSCWTSLHCMDFTLSIRVVCCVFSGLCNVCYVDCAPALAMDAIFRGYHRSLCVGENLRLIKIFCCWPY
jgi:hypothetical protein